MFRKGDTVIKRNYVNDRLALTTEGVVQYAGIKYAIILTQGKREELVCYANQTHKWELHIPFGFNV